ncbi:midas domain-containing protein [Natronococcus wangiae]|uniref:hypothetical protein n=1 Tax=Natronococcus wangiae TaxID=3068275 RepID=UPI0027400074|nr:hypothetical protein [Natronococcus sp. AD5]
MNRRCFTKLTISPLIGVLVGCTSFGTDSDGEDSETNNEANEDSLTDGETTNEDETDDEEANNDSDDPDEEETDSETGNETDDAEETSDESNEEVADDEETGDETDDEETNNDETGDDTDDSADADQEEEDGETGDEDQDEHENDEADEPPENDEMEATVTMDAELDEVLEIVDHEFIWESYPGSHLCNIRVELRNTSDTEIWFEGIGTTTDDTGNSLGGDIAQFGLDPGETTTYVFSMDRCADATGYQLEFEAR